MLILSAGKEGLVLTLSAARKGIVLTLSADSKVLVFTLGSSKNGLVLTLTAARGGASVKTQWASVKTQRSDPLSQSSVSRNLLPALNGFKPIMILYPTQIKTFWRRQRNQLDIVRNPLVSFL